MKRTGPGRSTLAGAMYVHGDGVVSREVWRLYWVEGVPMLKRDTYWKVGAHSMWTPDPEGETLTVPVMEWR